MVVFKYEKTIVGNIILFTAKGDQTSQIVNCGQSNMSYDIAQGTANVYKCTNGNPLQTGTYVLYFTNLNDTGVTSLINLILSLLNQNQIITNYTTANQLTFKAL